MTAVRVGQRSARPGLLAASLLCALSLAGAEEVTLLDDLTFPGRWQMDQWNKAPGRLAVEAGEAVPDGVLSVAIDWPADDEFRFFSLQPKAPRGAIPYRLTEVSIWVRTADPRHFLEVHFKDAKGADVKVGWQPTASAELQKLTHPLPADCAQPLTLASVTWHNWGLKGAGGSQTTLLARLEGTIDETQRLTPGEDWPDLLIGPVTPFGLADDQGRCSVALRLLSWRKVDQALTIEDELLGPEGGSLGRDRSEVAFTGEYSTRLSRQLPRFGSYPYTVTVTEAAGKELVSEAGTHLAWLPAVSGGASPAEDERLASPMGVNTHVGAPWEAFERMGIHWARDYSWGWLKHGETAPIGEGRDFSVVAAEAGEHKVLVLPITQAAFRNATETGFLEDSAAISAGFERLAKAFPHLPFWEIDNEYEFALRDKGFDVADYERALVAAAEGLRRAGGGKLVTNGTAGIRQDLAEALLESEARETFAVVNSHVYTGAEPLEVGLSDVEPGGGEGQVPLPPVDQLRQISRLAHEAGKESWLTEVGWDVSNGPAVGEARQAEYLPRAFLLARWAGIDKVFWFYDRDVPGSTIRFSTCGLMRLDGSLRPSAVAMAALSRETARAAIAGSLDFGEDIWAIVLRQPEGDWTVAVWSVREEHPLPEGFRGVAAVDLFGNEAQPDRITPSIVYFRLPQPPKAWDLQRQASWESLSVLAACPSGTVEARAAAAAGAFRWADLPVGVTSAGWRGEKGAYSDVLSVAPSVPLGRYLLTAQVRGEGWERTWPVTLLVRPALTVSGATTYEPNQPELLTVSAHADFRQVTARLVDDPGTLAPASFSLQPGRPQRIAVVPSPQASGALQVELVTDSGVRQQWTLHPVRKALPRLPDGALDGDLAGWPEATALPCVFAGGPASEAPAEVHLAGTAEGLLFSVRLPVEFLTPGNTEAFWESTNVELFVDPSAGEDGWTPSCRQVWFTPVREGEGWRLAAGQWRRVGAAGSVPEGRCRTRVVQQGESAVLAGLVPTEVLGQAPESGAVWRAAVSVRGVRPGSAFEAAWPRAKSDGVLTGPKGWGLVTFE